MHSGASDLALLLVTFGAILLIEPIVQMAAERTRLPRVTLLLALGLVVGGAGLGLVPAAAHDAFAPMAEVALAMVGFLLGGEFTGAKLRAHGRAVFALSIFVTGATWVLVAGGSWLYGLGVPAALVLGTAATATDPAACAAVTRETEAEGPVSSTLLGVVAVDDVWGLLLFGGVMAAIDVMLGGSANGSAAAAALELGGSLALGAALGVPMAWLSGRVQKGEPTLMEGLGFVLLACGIAQALHLSYLLANVAMGTVVANLARHHQRTFNEVEHIERPFLAVFFVLSGATVRLEGVLELAPLLAVYAVLRVAGRLLGGGLGAVAGGVPHRTIGIALLPQAGVALGMTLVALERFPELGRELLDVLVLATVVFETAGPLLTRWVLRRAGEAR